jgi:hypothetical protein
MQVEGSFIAVVARAFPTSAEDRFDQGAASLQFTVADETRKPGHNHEPAEHERAWFHGLDKLCPTLRDLRRRIHRRLQKTAPSDKRGAFPQERTGDTARLAAPTTYQIDAALYRQFPRVGFVLTGALLTAIVNSIKRGQLNRGQEMVSAVSPRTLPPHQHRRRSWLARPRGRHLAPKNRRSHTPP